MKKGNSFGKVILFLGVGVLFYGFFLRPVLSSETLRDEEVVLNPGQVISFDMDLTRTSKNVVHLDYEVTQGDAVDILLVKSESMEAASLEHVPNFSANATKSGSTEALVSPDFWSILIRPSSSTRTTVKIKSKIKRSRFFQRRSGTTTL